MSVILAFSIDVIGTFLCQCSYILMKKGHIEAEKSHSNVMMKSHMIMGFACLIVGSIIHVVMLPFCPLVLLATNSATAIVMSSCLAVYFLDEKISWLYDSTAFILICGGTTAMVLLSK